MDRRTFLIRCAALSAGGVLAATLPSWAQRALEEKTLRFDSDLYRRFTDPASTDRPFVRWWWNGDRVKADELVRELRLLHAAGVGGVEINPVKFPSIRIRCAGFRPNGSICSKRLSTKRSASG